MGWGLEVGAIKGKVLAALLVFSSGLGGQTMGAEGLGCILDLGR